MYPCTVLCYIALDTCGSHYPDMVDGAAKKDQASEEETSTPEKTPEPEKPPEPDETPEPSEETGPATEPPSEEGGADGKITKSMYSMDPFPVRVKSEH